MAVYTVLFTSSRFLLHLPPKGFVRIRHFGFLANRRRATLLPLCFAALHALPPQAESEPSTASTTQPLWRCPKCGGPMLVVERFTRGATPTPFSTTPGQGCMNSLAHNHTRYVFRASRRSVSPFHPDIFFLSLPKSSSAIDSSLHSRPLPS